MDSRLAHLLKRHRATGRDVYLHVKRKWPPGGPIKYTIQGNTRRGVVASHDASDACVVVIEPDGSKIRVPWARIKERKPRT